jgi:DNA replication licensing factor MCM6
MSRFDLFFVVVDERDEYLDTNIATHIVNLHRRKEEAVKPIFSQKEVLIYLKFCR